MPLPYDTTIGLEIHVQLKTASKMFCRCSNDSEGVQPNTLICPICVGHPGTLPVINEQAITMGARMALAIECTINPQSKFDRKNYFYPDLPKGYQISQYDQPLGIGGHIDIEVPAPEGQRTSAHIRFNRLHMEEDAAKLMHDGADSLVDYNRGGTPLMEIVTEPDIRSPLEAKTFLQELRLIARYLGVSDADMEKGHLRCDANVSVQLDQNGVRVTTPISEIKNLNSFKAVESALIYEAERLYQDYIAGGETQTRKNKITVGWDEQKGVTIMQRGKEEAHDYRYFPEPDLPPLHFSHEDIDALRASLPELPAHRRERFQTEYTISKADAHILVDDKALAEFFEKSASELAEWMSTDGVLSADSQTKSYQLLANWLLNRFVAILNDKKIPLVDTKVTPENFAQLIARIAEKKINSSSAQEVLGIMIDTGADTDQIIKEKGLEQVSDEGLIKELCEKVINANEKVVADIKAGKENALMFLVGQVMKESKGTAQPEMVKEILKGILSK
ncbi:MAG: Asp-tRNA(Asn)/Glu-tRNA(Gln) amidotransferase subunit GatB [bacterium]|nr:Asp-tRNA(Asn)/Glu-tRNA(Gln) amidotransferase subunit GatB [bacterium]